MKDRNYSQLIILLKEKMNRKTQADLAKLLGKSQPYVSMILNGKRKPKRSETLLNKIKKNLNNNFSNN